MTNWTYSDLRFYEYMLNEVKKTPGSNPSVIEDRIIEMKRQLRKNSNTTSDHLIVKDYGIDGFIEKFPLPFYIKELADAHEYFREYEYIILRPSAYDCTGQWFTSWYKIFRKPDGRFWAYHYVCRDV